MRSSTVLDLSAHPLSFKMNNILLSLRQMPCLLLCLVQWMETQAPSVARQAFARTIRDFENTCNKNKLAQPPNPTAEYIENRLA